MRFYGALFGWDFEVGPPETGRYTMCRLQGRAVAALMPNPDPNADAFWWNVYLATDDCDQTAERVRAAGGELLMEPMDVMGQGRMAIVRDPVGAQFGLWQGSRLRRLRDRQRTRCAGPQRPGHRRARTGARLLRSGVRLHPRRQSRSAGLRLHLPPPARRSRGRRDHGRAGSAVGVGHHLRGGRHRRGARGRAGRRQARPASRTTSSTAGWRPSPTRSAPSSPSSRDPH